MNNNSYKIIDKLSYGGMFVDKCMFELDTPGDLTIVQVPREVWEKHNVGDMYSPQQHNE